MNNWSGIWAFTVWKRVSRDLYSKYMTLIIQGLTPFFSGIGVRLHLLVDFQGVALVSAFTTVCKCQLLYWLPDWTSDLWATGSKIIMEWAWVSSTLCVYVYQACINICLLNITWTFSYAQTHGAQRMMQRRCSFFKCVFTCNIQWTITHLFLDIVKSQTFRRCYIRLCGFLNWSYIEDLKCTSTPVLC